jgi:hypothetical protein
MKLKGYPYWMRSSVEYAMAGGRAALRVRMVGEAGNPSIVSMTMLEHDAARRLGKLDDALQPSLARRRSSWGMARAVLPHAVLRGEVVWGI